MVVSLTKYNRNLGQEVKAAKEEEDPAGFLVGIFRGTVARILSLEEKEETGKKQENGRASRRNAAPQKPRNPRLIRCGLAVVDSLLIRAELRRVHLLVHWIFDSFKWR